VAVVTGAGSGIGRATVLRFVEEGAAVVANDLSEDALEATLAAARSLGSGVHGQQGDITQVEANDALVAAALQHFGQLDIFHCNAGGAQPVPLLDTSDDDYRAQLALNLDSVWFGARAALRAMVPKRSGVILATTSGAGLGAVAGLAAYGAAKAGVIALVRSIALEFGAQGIRANAISPGPMATPALLEALEDAPGGAAAFEAQVPSGKLGSPDDVADAAVFLASDEARYVSGAVLPVDGAIHSVLAAPKLL
jgi:3-oxoacyl-[acyl-carrier protein] reductase